MSTGTIGLGMDLTILQIPYIHKRRMYLVSYKLHLCYNNTLFSCNINIGGVWFELNAILCEFSGDFSYFPALSRAMAAVSGVPFSMYIMQAFSMYWMASGIFFCSCWNANSDSRMLLTYYFHLHSNELQCVHNCGAYLHHHTRLFNSPGKEEENLN